MEKYVFECNKVLTIVKAETEKDALIKFVNDFWGDIDNSGEIILCGNLKDYGKNI